jgi:hypothetical protein
MGHAAASLVEPLRSRLCVHTLSFTLGLLHILKMEAARFFETSVNIYQTTSQNINILDWGTYHRLIVPVTLWICIREVLGSNLGRYSWLSRLRFSWFSLVPPGQSRMIFQLGFKVLTAVVIKSYIIWDITLNSTLKFDRCFGGTCRFHLQDRIRRTR